MRKEYFYHLIFKWFLSTFQTKKYKVFIYIIYIYLYIGVYIYIYIYLIYRGALRKEIYTNNGFTHLEEHNSITVNVTVI